MKSKNNKVKVVCDRLIPDGNGGVKKCGSTNLTMSGSNSWWTLCKSTDGNPSIKVLKQRYICGDCGGFHFTHLDGSPLIKDVSENEIKRLVKLTKEKLSHNNGGNNDTTRR
jgi:transposase-like protein